MASQNIIINNAEITGVPFLRSPKVGGGFARFTEVSDTDAVAEDVASGKKFYLADGSLAIGSASGGTVNLVRCALRPDAVLMKTWSADDLIVEDLEWTIPAYSTSQKTVHTGSALGTTYALDYDYDWFVVEKLLLTPIYTTSAGAKGKPIYSAGCYFYEIVSFPPNTFEHAGKSYATRSTTTSARGSVTREAYWSSASAVSAYTATTYGVGQTAVAPSISNGALTVSDPTVVMRGSTTYFTSTVWGTLTDMRRQYRIELYRSPKANLNVDGWEGFDTLSHIIADAQGNGTLT